MKPFAAAVLLFFALGISAPVQAQISSGYCPTCYSVIAVSDVTGQTSSQSTVALVSSASKSGNYMIRWYADVSTPCSLTAGGNVMFTFVWKDASVTRNFVSPPLNATISNGVGNYISGTVPIYAASMSAITYSSNYTVACGGTSHLAYDIHVSVETTQNSRYQLFADTGASVMKAFAAILLFALIIGITVSVQAKTVTGAVFVQATTQRPTA